MSLAGVIDEKERVFVVEVGIYLVFYTVPVSCIPVSFSSKIFLIE